MLRQPDAHGDEREHVRMRDRPPNRLPRRGWRNRTAFAREGLPHDAIDARSATRAAEWSPPARLPPGRRPAAALPAANRIGAKRSANRSSVSRVHRLGAVQRRAQRAQVETLDVAIGHFAHGKFVSEIGRRGQRAAMADAAPRASAPDGSETRSAKAPRPAGRNRAASARRRSVPCRDRAAAN